MLDRVDALIGRVAAGLVRVGAVILATLMLMTFCDVIGRYFFNRPIVGTVEMTELFMGLIIYLGVGLTTQTRAHITVDLLTSRLPTRARLVCDLVAQLLSLMLVAVISWQLWVIAAERVANDDRTQVWELPVYPVAYGMAVASVLMVAVLVLHVAQALHAVFPRRSR